MGRNIRILGIVFGINAILMASVAITQTLDSSFNNVFLILLVACIFTGSISLGFLGYAFFTRCPSCNSLFAQVEDTSKKEALSRTKGYRTKTETQDIKNPNGDVIGKTERTYQVRVLTSVHRHYYQCKICNHAWTKDIKTTRENFNDDD
jgi:hypothetical protein